MTTTDTKIEITKDNVLELLKRAVDEKGESYVYKPEGIDEAGERHGTCDYFERDGTPSCIVGHVLHYAGYVPDDVEEGVGAWTLGQELGLEQHVIDALEQAQVEQDAGGTWGAAYRAAEAELQNRVDLDD